MSLSARLRLRASELGFMQLDCSRMRLRQQQLKLLGPVMLWIWWNCLHLYVGSTSILNAIGTPGEIFLSVTGFLVDTNIPSELTRQRPDPNVASFLRRTDKRQMFLSVMTVGEICKGIASLPSSHKRSSLQIWLDLDVRSWFDGRNLPVTEPIAEMWGGLAASARQRGMPLAVVDGVIAATAIQHRLTVVTRNLKDFASLGVDLLNPWEP